MARFRLVGAPVDLLAGDLFAGAVSGVALDFRVRRAYAELDRREAAAAADIDTGGRPDLGALRRRVIDAAMARYVELHAHRPKQRSVPWLALRIDEPHIGGSEVAAVMGLNPYKSQRDVVCEKAAPHARAAFGNVACYWGTLFEPVTTAHVERACGVVLLATDLGSVPGVRHHKYSSDAVGRIPFWEYACPETGDAVLEVAFPGDAPPAPGAVQREWCAVVEFKDPYRRFPKPDVPAMYHPQVLMGIDTVSPAELGLFVEAVHRKCAWRDLGAGPQIDRAYHGNAGLRRWRGALAWGAFAVWAPPDDAAALHPDDAALLRAVVAYEHGPVAAYAPVVRDHGPVDLGDTHGELFGKNETGGVLALIDRGVCVARSSREVRPGDPPLDAAELARDPPPGWVLFGVLPWKLMEIAFHPVRPDPVFVAAAAARIAETIELVLACRAAPDPLAAAHAHFDALAAGDSGSPNTAFEDEFFAAIAARKSAPRSADFGAPRSAAKNTAFEDEFFAAIAARQPATTSR